jgi:hypothetical protein
MSGPSPRPRAAEAQTHATEGHSRGGRRSASPATNPERGRLQQAVSVRFMEDELRRIQAYAVVLGTSPNAIIREACDYFLYDKVRSKEYEEALAAYRRRSEEQVAALEEMRDVS